MPASLKKVVGHEVRSGVQAGLAGIAEVKGRTVIVVDPYHHRARKSTIR
jgi:hypothetical protein